MNWLALSLCAIYSVLLLFCRKIWKGIPHVKLINYDLNERVTVLVPARNEESNIHATLDCILSNDYPKDLLQVIVIDDHSDDGTADVVNSVDGVELLKLDSDRQGKKNAITHGVNNSSGDLIICTDADTKVSNHWVKMHVLSFREGNQLSFGPVEYIGKWSNMLNLELYSLVMFGAVYNAIGKTGMINGCNYSFSRAVFKEVNAFEGNLDIASGDDEFLLRKVHALYPRKVKFLKAKEALVKTIPAETLRGLIHQRRRWASKWRYHEDLASKVSPIAVFFFYLIILLSLIQSFWSGEWGALFIALMIKMVSEYLFCSGYNSIVQDRVSLWGILKLEIIYPFYAVFVGVTSNFGRYSWRGRKFKT
ncbi:glycosyltransferase [Reichenbachiella versicolor]|uniref:glycosyltransferase n=1 Tax=Reichenbachiella versicolor TaxID=1821036 RepID=UPI000D6EA762|nr:glycosyltransferase [Reichenbachiella versicolor]